MNKTLSLITVPGSDCRRFKETLAICMDTTADLTLVDAGELAGTLSNQKAEQCGVFICDPAVRLKQSYDGLYAQDKVSGTFRDFYTARARIDYLSALLKNIEISTLGFVGVQEYYAKSLLIAEAWSGRAFTTVSPAKMVNVSQQVLDTITSDEYAEIKNIHQSDYALYESIKTQFIATYTAHLQNRSLINKTNKPIVLHLGPPKTGTSTIQSWLLNNRTPLSKAGVDYPQHHYDKNGISSGNFTSLLSRVNGQVWRFDDDKARTFITQFAGSSKQLLLLSSEHFFYTLPWLFSRLPNAEFIFYIRHPLSLLESTYHQHIKRHGGDRIFSQPEAVAFEQLHAVSDVAQQFSVKINYRYLDSALLVNNNLVDDFVSLLPLGNTEPRVSKKVNTQYRPGALELMRICNRLPERYLIAELDMFLQSISESQPSFSLIEPERIKTLQQSLIRQAEELSGGDEQLDIVQLKALLERYQQPPYLSFDARGDDMQECLRLLVARKPRLATMLLAEASKNNQREVTTLLMPLLTRRRPGITRARLRKLVSRFAKIFR